MTLTVLSDKDVREILHSLSLEEVQRLQQNLAGALHDYSTGTQETAAACSANQPSRIQLYNKDTTTLFIPARTASATAVKVLTLASPAPPSSSDGASTLSKTSSTIPSEVSSISSLSISRKSSVSTSTTNATAVSSNSNGAEASSASTAPTSISSTDKDNISQTTTTPRGTLTLLHPSGAPLAFLAAEELTAFRTALASTLLFAKRSRAHTIAVFGAGKQAYWHIRLALLLRGQDVHHVRIVNRSFASAEPLLRAIYTDPQWTEFRSKHCHQKLEFSIVSPDYGEYSRMLKALVRDADAVFCCTPATQPLFPAELLTSPEGRRKGRYISCIGSYRPHMIELDPLILRQAVSANSHDGSDSSSSHHKGLTLHTHKHADPGVGVIVVDSLEACMREAGEVVQSDLSPEQLVELGELIMVKRAAKREVELGLGNGEEGLVRWLQAGNVIYKSVGLGLMDTCVGEDIVALATEKGIGVKVPEF